MAASAALALDIKAKDVIVASTGVIGVSLEIEKIEAAVPSLAKLCRRMAAMPPRKLS